MIGIGQGVLILAIIASFFVSRDESLASPPAFKVRWSSWFLGASIAINLVSVLVHLDSYEAPIKDIKKLRHLILPFLVLILPKIRHLITTEGNTFGKWWWIAMLFVAIAVTLADMINLYTGFHPIFPVEGIARKSRLGGVFGMVMTYAYSMQFTILVVFGVVCLLWRKEIVTTRFVGVISVLALIICGIGLFFSGSRGALLGCFVGAILLIAILRWKWMMIGFGICFVLAVLASSIMDNRLLKPSSQESVRFSQWKTAAITGIKNPVIGIGYRQFEKQCRDLKIEYGFPRDVTVFLPPSDESGGVRTERDWKDAHAHNNYLEAFASTGILGLLALSGFLVCWLREVWSQPKTRLIFAPAISGFLVAGFFENSFTDSEVTVLVMSFYVASQIMLASGGQEALESAATMEAD